MQKTGIEYLDFTYNTVKGKCPRGCWFCYMDRPPSCWAIQKNPTLRLDERVLAQKFPNNGSLIGVGYNIELLHKKIPTEWIQATINNIRERGQKDTFLFLTKNPARYAEFDFPDNCWLGVTVTRDWEVGKFESLKKKDNIRFISFEPLLDHCSIPVNRVDWVIVGAMTGTQSKAHQPKFSWVHAIVQTCRALNIPVFLKNNLKAVWGEEPLIQEYPHVLNEVKEKGASHEEGTDDRG